MSPEPFDLAVRSRRVWTSAGLRPARVLVRGHRIHALAPHDDQSPARDRIDAGERLVLPGVVDSHVHINEPGRTEWEGFATATEAAVAGGVTTLVDMPLNCIPATTSKAAALEKLASLQGKLHADVAFWGGVVPGNAGELAGLAELGVPGAKCFLVPSGVDEFPHVTRADLDVAMPVLRDLHLTLLVHAELPGPIDQAEAALRAEGADPRRYGTYLRSRPPEAEDEAIRLVIELAAKHGTRCHIVHLASASAVPLLRDAQARGVRVSAETCLHYLAFSAESIPDGATHYKCAPPIRERAHQEGLWEGLADGTLSMVVSDHSPCTPHLKRLEAGDFLGAWGGIAGLQFGLGVMSALARERGFGLDRVMEWMVRAPARLAGLNHRKGLLAPGFDADLTVIDDRGGERVTAESVRHRHKLTPYDGRELSGVVCTTIVRGGVAFDRERFPSTRGIAPARGDFVPVRRPTHG